MSNKPHIHIILLALAGVLVLVAHAQDVRPGRVNQTSVIQVDRLVPSLPPAGQKLRLLIDTDFANEIDDLYAVALALASPERFDIEGFVLAHFNNKNGPDSINASYNLFMEFLEASGLKGRYPAYKGAPPMTYYGFPSEGEGVDFIIKRAHAGTPENPLWVVGLGASTNLASAILKDPSIIPKVRYVFHARNSHNWPLRSTQYNIRGDIHAARALLASWVPLVWFDTGAQLKCSMETGEKYIASTGPMGKFIHEYRLREPVWQNTDKGFFDLADIAWMLAPEIAKAETIYAPAMDPYMFFDHAALNGKMVRVYDMDSNAAWNLFIDRLSAFKP